MILLDDIFWFFDPRRSMARRIQWLVLLPFLLNTSCLVWTGYRSQNGIGFYNQATRSALGATELPGPKHGDACAYNIFGIVSVGNAGITKAKENGHITKVATVDHDFSNIFYSFGRYCVVITGE